MTLLSNLTKFEKNYLYFIFKIKMENKFKIKAYSLLVFVLFINKSICDLIVKAPSDLIQKFKSKYIKQIKAKNSKIF